MKTIILISIAFMFLNCTGRDLTNKDVKNDFNKICVEGHVYYQQREVYGQVIFIKLDDNGKPVKCGE